MATMNSFISFNKKIFSSNISDYSLDEVLNSKGTIYKATLKVPVHMSCILRKINLFDRDLDLYERENDLDKTIDHPNIIQMITSFIHEDFLYTIYPFAEYSSIDVINKPYGLEECIVVHVLRDILSAIDYLHKNSIIHRAIKGSHILIFRGLNKDSVKFVLSGLKYTQQVDNENSATSFNLKTFEYPKQAVNLLKYLAPEILEQNLLGYDHKSDIYSVGILCCEMANGMVPFDNMSPDEILFYKIIGDTPRLLDDSCEEMTIFKEYLDKLEPSLRHRYKIYMRKHFSGEFHEFTHKCLHLEPVQRPKAETLMVHPLLKRDNKNMEKITNLIKKLAPKTNKDTPFDDPISGKTLKRSIHKR